MVFCVECGFDCKDTFKFCPQCGTKTQVGTSQQQQSHAAGASQSPAGSAHTENANGHEQHLRLLDELDQPTDQFNKYAAAIFSAIDYAVEPKGTGWVEYPKLMHFQTMCSATGVPDWGGLRPEDAMFALQEMQCEAHFVPLHPRQSDAYRAYEQKKAQVRQQQEELRRKQLEEQRQCQNLMGMHNVQLFQSMDAATQAQIQELEDKLKTASQQIALSRAGFYRFLMLMIQEDPDSVFTQLARGCKKLNIDSLPALTRNMLPANPNKQTQALVASVKARLEQRAQQEVELAKFWARKHEEMLNHCVSIVSGDRHVYHHYGY